MRVTVNGKDTYLSASGTCRSHAVGRPAVLLVHGSGMDHTIWMFQARALAGEGRLVYAVDLPGHGRSEGSPFVSVVEGAVWLRQLVDQLQLQPVSLVGHSLGSLLALETANQHPSWVERLVLVGTSAQMTVQPKLLQNAWEDPATAREMIIGWSYGTRGRRGGHLAAGLWLHGSGRRLLERSAPGVLAQDLRICDGYPGMKQAPQVNCPVLVLVGSEDRMTPLRSAQQMANTLPDATLRVVPETGHMVMLEDPVTTLRIVSDFLPVKIKT